VKAVCGARRLLQCCQLPDINSSDISRYIWNCSRYFTPVPIPVAVRSKAWVCGRSLTGIVGLNCDWDCGGHGCLSVVSVVCCQVEVSETSWSLVHRSPSECGESKKCDREASKNEAA
jgi:hypothetical protein